jgi:hypothetical protein
MEEIPLFAKSPKNLTSLEQGDDVESSEKKLISSTVWIPRLR